MTHFLSGRISVIDTVARAVVAVISTGSDSNMAQKIALHPSNGRAYLPHTRSNIANRSLLFDTTLFPLVSFVDLAAQHVLAAERVDLSLGPHSVNLPFDLAFAPDGQRLYVGAWGAEAAVLPSSRSVRVGTPATAFITAVNAGTSTATGVRIGVPASLAGTFTFQTTDATTNQVTGIPNTPVDIPAGVSQRFVIAFTPQAAIAPTDTALIVSGTNMGLVEPRVGLNTLLLTICQTNPGTGGCLDAPAPQVSAQIDAGQTPTFAIVVQASGPIPLDPAANRVFVEFRDAGGVVRGKTSVAVQTR